jgi:hypothetical protein
VGEIEASDVAGSEDMTTTPTDLIGSAAKQGDTSDYNKPAAYRELNAQLKELFSDENNGLANAANLCAVLSPAPIRLYSKASGSHRVSI